MNLYNETDMQYTPSSVACPNRKRTVACGGGCIAAVVGSIAGVFIFCGALFYFLNDQDRKNGYKVHVDNNSPSNDRVGGGTNNLL